MTVALPMELKVRIVRAHKEAPEMALTELAQRFGVHETTVGRYIRRDASGQGLEEAPRTYGPPPKLKNKHLAWIRETLGQEPTLTSYELKDRFNRKFRADQVHRSTILRAMRALGFTVKKRPLSRRSKPGQK